MRSWCFDHDLHTLNFCKLAHRIKKIDLVNPNWNLMLLAVVIAKSLIELSLMFIIGRFLLGLLAGAKRDTNVFWQLLDVASKPALWFTRKISPKLILDQHIPLATSSWLLIAWVVVVQLKIEICLEMGIAACQ
jgi:hypothetical protein